MTSRTITTRASATTACEATTEPEWMAPQAGLGKLKFRMMIRKVSLEAPEQILEVDRDLALRIEAKVAPEEDPDSFYWKG